MGFIFLTVLFYTMIGSFVESPRHCGDFERWRRCFFWLGLSTKNSNDRVVIPPQLRYQVLCALHAAHQGVSAMERRARATVFWLGMTQDIDNIRDSCAYCNRNALSQAAAPRCPPTRFCYLFFYFAGKTISSFSLFIKLYRFENESYSLSFNYFGLIYNLLLLIY